MYKDYEVVLEEEAKRRADEEEKIRQEELEKIIEERK